MAPALLVNKRYGLDDMNIALTGERLRPGSARRLP